MSDHGARIAAFSSRTKRPKRNTDLRAECVFLLLNYGFAMRRKNLLGHVVGWGSVKVKKLVRSVFV